MADPLLKADALKDNPAEQIQDLQERLAELERFALTSQNILANKIGVGNANLDDIDDGDIATIPWTDHSSDSTIVGWSSYTEGVIEYKKIGKLVYVNFRIGGTSDDVATTFTVPFSEGQIGNPIFWCRSVDDGGSAVAAYGQLDGSIVTLLPNATSGAWTASGTKSVHGQFWYETN